MIVVSDRSTPVAAVFAGEPENVPRTVISGAGAADTSMIFIACVLPVALAAWGVFTDATPFTPAAAAGRSSKFHRRYSVVAPVAFVTKLLLSTVPLRPPSALE